MNNAKRIKQIIALVIAASITILMLCAAVKSFAALGKGNKVVDSAQYDYKSVCEQLDDDSLFKSEELYIISGYADMSNKKSNESEKMYYLVMFSDAEENVCYASLRVDAQNKEIYAKLKSYHDDKEQFIGDLVIPVCASLDTSSEKKDELAQIYKDSMDEYNKIFDNTVIDSGLVLKYECDNEQSNIDNYFDELASSNRVAGIFFALMTAIGVAVIVVIAVRIKKAKVNVNVDVDVNIVAEETASPSEKL